MAISPNRKVAKSIPYEKEKLTDESEGISPADVDGVVERLAVAVPEDVDVDELDQLVDEVLARRKCFTVGNEPESNPG